MTHEIWVDPNGGLHEVTEHGDVIDELHIFPNDDEDDL